LTARPAVFPELTERERQTLELIAQGHKNTVIAERLHLSPKTVRNYVTSIFDKLQTGGSIAGDRQSARGGPGLETSRFDAGRIS
jgi:DNA-binding NarL/FixJ family response regulator